MKCSAIVLERARRLQARYAAREFGVLAAPVVVRPSIPVAYLNGVLYGDGWCTAKEIGLRAKDGDFVEAFRAAFVLVFGLAMPVHEEDRGEGRVYIRARKSNVRGQYDWLRSFVPTGDVECAAWLRGLFDSEGNVYLKPSKMSENSWYRHVRIYSTRSETLEQATDYLHQIGIDSYTRETKTHLHSLHKGTKPVFELTIRSSPDGYSRFARLVGSNIKRKRDLVNAIPFSYQSPEYYRKGQLAGAASKRRSLFAVKLPKVIERIVALIESGTNPTIVRCCDVEGYHGLRDIFRHSELVNMARESRVS